MSTAFILAVIPLISHATSSCDADVDACVRTLIAENAGMILECGKSFPAAKPLFDAAFKHWPVLKMAIPGLPEILDENSEIRMKSNQDAVEFLEQMPRDQQEAECTARLAMLTTRQPTLTGKAARFPPDALKKYAQ